MTIDVEDADETHLQEAINRIKAGFVQAKEEALRFKAFLETLTPQQRMNDFVLRRLWEKQQQRQ